MTHASIPPTKLRIFVKWTLISVFLVALIWFVVILWWQSTQRIVTLEDTLLYLFFLPCAVLAAIALFRLIRHASKKRAKKKDQAQKSVMASAVAPALSQQEMERDLKLPVLSVWGLTSLADNAEQFTLALNERRSRPHPDEFLRDERGFPLMSGRVKDLDTSTIEEYLQQSIASNNLDNIPDFENWRDAFLRALALLTHIIDQAHDDWPLSDDMFADTNGYAPSGTLRGTPATRAAAPDLLSLQVKLIVSADFAPYEKQLARLYLAEKLAHFHIPADRFHIEVIASNDDTSALAIADHFMLHTHRSNATQALLVLACDSTLCMTVAEQWQSNGRLFSVHCPTGLMMGEAAFGILYATPKTLALLELDAACHLTRASLEKREQSADIPGKPSNVCLTQVVGSALDYAGISGEKIGSVTCDADHRTNRTLECIGAMMQHTPQLDAIEHRLAANEACGHIGSASMMAALVAGVTQVKNTDQHVLLFNVSHAAERGAAVLVPNNALATATEAAITA